MVVLLTKCFLVLDYHSHFLHEDPVVLLNLGVFFYIQKVKVRLRKRMAIMKGPSCFQQAKEARADGMSLMA
jgi:hypothetical protein